jgi:hypothetical protein
VRDVLRRFVGAVADHTEIVVWTLETVDAGMRFGDDARTSAAVDSGEGRHDGGSNVSVYEVNKGGILLRIRSIQLNRPVSWAGETCRFPAF